MPLVSILTPTYNHGRYIRHCVETVLAQTFVDWEMVVVDDGSTDDTVDIARSYRDRRIQVIELPHRGLAGLAETYAAGVANSHGPLLAVLEGDDEWPPDKLACQVPLLTRGVVLVYGQAQLIDSDGVSFGVARRVPRLLRVRRNDPPPSALEALLFDNFIVSSTVLIDRRALERAGGFRQPGGCLYVDHPTYLALALEGRFGYLPQVAGRWRRHAMQATREHHDLSTQNVAYRYDAIERALELIGEDRVREMRRRLDRHVRWMRDYDLILQSRLAGLSGAWPEAQASARAALRSRFFSVKALATVAAITAVMRRDAEPLYRRLGMFTWR